MKKPISLLVLALASSLLLSGCIIINVEKAGKPKPGAEESDGAACEHCEEAKS